MTKPHSIRRSLLVRIGVCTGLLLLALSTWIYLTVRHGLYHELDTAISQTAALLSNQVELENGRIIFEWQEGQGTNRALIDDGLFQFWNETTGETTRSPGLQLFHLPRFCGEGTTPILKDITLPRNHHHARAIGIRIYPYNAPEDLEHAAEKKLVDPKTQPHILVVARDAKPIHRVLNRVRWILGIGTLLTLGIIHLLVSRVIRISLLPIDALAHQMKNRSEQELDSPLEMPDSLPCELKGVAESFDVLLGRVAGARIRERDFIRHAAHELRTPIAGLRAVTDLALSQSRTAVEYANQLLTCQRTAVELGELVKRLTALARVGQKNTPVTLAQVNLTQLLQDCLSSFSAAIEQRDLTLIDDFHSTPVSAQADEALARIIFNNLLDNAVCYTNPGGEIRIKTEVRDGLVKIIIANAAATVPEDTARLFEPLFRADTSRHDAASHLGIGLTLSREAATAMNATLLARKPADGWIEFILTLCQK